MNYRPVARQEFFLGLIRRCFRFLGDDDALVLTFHDQVGVFSKLGNQIVHRFETGNLIVKAYVQDGVFLVHRRKINDDLDLIAHMIHPDIGEEKF